MFFRIFIILTLYSETSWADEAFSSCNYTSSEENNNTSSKGTFSCTNLESPEEIRSRILKVAEAYSSAIVNVSALYITRSNFNNLSFKSLNLLTTLVKLSIDHSCIDTIRQRAFEELKFLEVLELNFNRIVNIQYGPFIELATLKVLKLSRIAYIKELPHNIFSELIKLETLDLSMNELQTINREDFVHLTELHTLNLSENRIERIHPETFSDLKKLEVLDLSVNYIMSLEKNTFKGLNNLKFLFLNVNAIRDFDISVFRLMENLEMLNLERNKILKLENVFANLKNLVVLKLGNNLNLELNSDTFAGLDSLTGLDLSFCDLRTLPDGIFDGLTKLNKLKLRNNQLGSNLSPELVERLKSIRQVDFSENMQLPTYGDYGASAFGHGQYF